MTDPKGEMLEVSVSVGHDDETPNEWWVRTVIKRPNVEEAIDDVTGPFPSKEAAMEAADDLMAMLEEVQGNKEPLYDRFLAIAHSDRSPHDQLMAVRDLLKPVMLRDFTLSMRTGRMFHSQALTDLLAMPEFHAWCCRDGIRGQVKQAFLDIGKELKG